jgi:SNF family Na+-dependent transporter
VIFSFLGHVATKLNVNIDEIPIEKGEELAFIAYPGLMTLLPGSNFWSIVFFLMLFTVGIDSVFTMQEFTLAYILDALKVYFG